MLKKETCPYWLALAETPCSATVQGATEIVAFKGRHGADDTLERAIFGLVVSLPGLSAFVTGLPATAPV